MNNSDDIIRTLGLITTAALDRFPEIDNYKISSPFWNNCSDFENLCNRKLKLNSVNGLASYKIVRAVICTKKYSFNKLTPTVSDSDIGSIWYFCDEYAARLKKESIITGEGTTTPGQENTKLFHFHSLLEGRSALDFANSFMSLSQHPGLLQHPSNSINNIEVGPDIVPKIVEFPSVFESHDHNILYLMHKSHHSSLSDLE